MLRRQRAIEIVPRSKPLRWRRYDVPQHLAPEPGDALRFCAVEGDLELLDRRHRSTIGGLRRVVLASDVDAGATVGIGFDLADDLADDGGGVAAAEQEVADHVHQRAALGPGEVTVRLPAGGLAESEEDRGDGIG